MPLNCFQHISSPLLHPRWAKTAAFLYLENQFLYERKKAVLAWKPQTLLYIAICSIFLFFFEIFTSNKGCAVALESFFLSKISVRHCYPLLTSLPSIHSSALTRVFLRTTDTKMHSFYPRPLRNQGGRVMVPWASASSPHCTVFCTFIPLFLW